MEYKLPPIFEGRTFTVRRLRIQGPSPKLWLVSDDGVIIALIHPAETRLLTYFKREPDMGLSQMYRGVHGDPAKDEPIGDLISLGEI